jgi:hypothetical protein
MAEELKACEGRKKKIKSVDKLNLLLTTHIGDRWMTIDDNYTMIRQVSLVYNNIRSIQDNINEKT